MPIPDMPKVVLLTDRQRRVIVYALHMLHANLDDDAEESLGMYDVEIYNEAEMIELALGSLPPST